MKGKKISNSIPFTLAFLLASIAEILFPLFGKNPPLAKKSAIATGTNRLVSTEKAKTLLGWTSKISYPTSMQRIKESLN
jgi:nucleoside-diphosphate-sugar epimerase